MDQVDKVFALADWRRQVAELYAQVRANPAPRKAWEDWRASRDRLFRAHPQSPLGPVESARFSALPYFDYDPAFRHLVELGEPAAREPQSWDLGEDGRITLEPAARTRGLRPALGAELTLYWIAGYGGGLFLSFTDATSGTASYGGGRYLLDGIKGADLGMTDGRLVLDFNFAYNPSCCHDPRWTCPLAPPENRLPAAVCAGEQAPAVAAALRAHG